MPDRWGQTRWNVSGHLVEEKGPVSGRKMSCMADGSSGAELVGRNQN